jgi:lipopolysaccharide export system permease protein
MISILTRHISKTIITATALVSLIIVGVLFLMSLLGELKSIGSGDYGLIQAVMYVFFRLPSQLYQFSPMLILLGSITGLSVLASYRELAVMRTSGFSVFRIMFSSFYAAILLLVLMTSIGEWIAPNLSYQAEIRKENAQNGGQSVVTAAGVWFHAGNNFIHVQHVIDRQLLQGVTRYQFDNKHKLLAAYFAKTLVFEDKQWLMKEVVKTSFYNDRTVSSSIPLAIWDVKFNPNLLNAGLVEPDEMSLSRLSKFIVYLKQNGLQAAGYQYEYWQRLFQPIASLIMVFLAIPFVLGSLGAVTLGQRLLLGIMVGFVFFIANAFLGQISIVYQVPAVLAALLPLLGFAVLGVVLTVCLI